MRILVIDDEQPIRDMMSTMLALSGFECVVFPGGKEAMEYLKCDHDFQLVITDLLMPNFDGLETIRNLKEFCSDLHILAISGGGQLEADSYLKIARKMGALHTLKKPFTKSILLQKIVEIEKSMRNQPASA